MLDSDDERRGSGKQILLRILTTLSTRITDREMLDDATRRLRAGLLLRGSTSDDSFDNVRQLGWATKRDDSGEIVRQGIGTRRGNVFVSDVFESLREMPGLVQFIRDQHAGATDDEIEACLWAIWAVVSSVQMFSSLLAVETDGAIDLERWVENYDAKYNQHFRDRGIDPEPR